MRAVVVGGGIGGLTAAHSLIAEGLDVIVLEQAPVLEEIGAGVNLAPNATRILRKLGLLEAMLRDAVVPELLAYRRWSDGEIIACRFIGPEVEDVMGAPYLSMHRADVQRVLLESLPPGVVRLGAKVVAAEQNDHEAIAILEDGSTETGTLIVAADGIRSPLRSLLFGDPTPTYSGFSAYRSVIAREALAGLDVPECSNWLGPQAHLVHYWVRRGELLNIVAAVRTPLAEDSWMAEAKSEELVAAFEGWNDQLVSILRRATVVLKRGIFYRHPLEQWSVGRVVFMGDSAHAMTPFIGQGAAQAILDAAVLGKSLAGIDTEDVPRALTSFAVKRHDSAVDAHRRSAVEGERFHLPDGPLSEARDDAMRVLATRDPYMGLGPVWRENVYLDN